MLRSVASFGRRAGSAQPALAPKAWRPINANIASTDRPACLIASAAYCRVCYSTVLASIASPGALMHGLKLATALALQPSVAKLYYRAAVRLARRFNMNETDCAPTNPQKAMMKCVRRGA